MTRHAQGARTRQVTLLPFVLVALALSSACRHAETASSLTPRERAQYHLKKNEPEQALPLLEHLHAQAPGDLEIARELTEASVRAGRAEALIARLEALPPSKAVEHYMLGLAYFSRSRDADGRAVEELGKAAALAPGEAELHYRLGLALLESERYEAALGPLEKARALAPERGGYLLPLAKARYRTGDRARALEAIRSAIAGEPTPAEVKSARALMEHLSDPFAGLPQEARGRLEAGLAWLHDRDIPQQAIVAFEEISRDYPDAAIVHALLGLAYQRIDDAGRAVDELRRAIELAPEDGKNHFYLGELYLSRQRPKEAREQLERALMLHPLIDDAYVRLGDLALERQDLEEARKRFRTLTLLQPEAIPPRGKLALVHQLAGDWAAADRELKRILERDAESLEFKLRLGLLHAERHRKASRREEREAAAEEASRWLREVLTQQPENALASAALASLKR